MQSVRGIALLASVLIAGYLLVSRSQVLESGSASSADDAPKASKPVAGREETAVKLDPEAQEKGGIETAAPKEITYQAQARAYGVILPLDRLTSLFNSSRPPPCSLSRRKVKLAASKIANARAQNLLKVFPTAAAQAEAAEAASNMDAAGVEAAKAQVETVSNAAIQEFGPILGQAIAQRSPLAEGLVLRKSSLIQLTLQPGAGIEPPEQISVTFGNGATAEASFVAEATQVDPKIPNVSFLYTIPRRPRVLVGISAVASFPNGDAKPGVGIPPSAVVWQAGRAWMYVQNGTDRFRTPRDRR